MSQNASTTTGTRRESIESIAKQNGIEQSQLTPDVIYTLGQLECAKRIAVSEGCGSGELPDRLRAKVEEREAELRRLIEHQSTEATEPRPIDLGVSKMLTTCFSGSTQWEALRVPLNAVAEIVGEPWDGSQAHQSTLQLTLAQDQNCPEWVRDCRMCFSRDGFVVLLGPFAPSAIPSADEDEQHQQDEASTPEYPRGWRRSALERLRELEKEVAAMPIHHLGQTIRDRMYYAYQVAAVDGEQGYVFQTDELTRKGLNSMAAYILLLDEFAFPEPDSDDAGEQSPALASVVPLPDRAPAAPKRAPEVLTAADELYDAEMALAFAFMALGRSPSEGVCLDPSENAGLIGLIDRARWIVRDQRHAIVGEQDEG